MKKWLFLLGLGGLLLWWKRHSLIPTPQVDEGPAPKFRTAETPRQAAADNAAQTHGNGAKATESSVATEPANAHTTTTTGSDDMQRVKGIGPVYERRLSALGVSSYADLVAADSETVAEELDVAVEAVEDWKGQARDWA